MKKIITFLLLFVIFFQVSASQNKLYFTEKGKRIYYDSKLYKDNIFIYHDDMVPGSSYENSLEIENGTKNTYELFLSLKEEEIKETAFAFLKNIETEIYLDNELIYKGSIINQEEKNTIKLGEFKPNKKSTLLVKTKLAEKYSDINYHEETNVNWQFLVKIDEKLMELNPNTSDYIIQFICIFFILVVCLVLLLLARKKWN